MSTNPLVKDLPLFPFTRDRQLDLPGEYAEVSGGCPIPVRLWNDQHSWLVGNHADFLSVLMDERFSGEFARPDFPCVTTARRAIDKAEKSFVGMDNPRHDQYRRMVMKEFTAKRMLALRPSIEAIADDLLDAMARDGPPCELVAALAVELPALVMCALFGSPYEDHHYIAKLAAGRHGLTQSPQEAATAAAELVEYCRKLIARKEAQPADDMISRVIQEWVLPGLLSRDEFSDTMAHDNCRPNSPTFPNLIKRIF